MSLDYIAIDFETANTYQDSACSVGVVRFVDGRETDSVYSLIRPAKMYFIPEWTEEIHLISYGDVRDKAQFPEVWDTLIMPFLSKTPDFPLVAHNARFDMGVIRACYEYYGMNMTDFRYFDSLRVAQKTWSELKCHKLTFLGEHFGISYKAHDALDDSRVCGKIIALAAQKHGVENVDSLLAACGLGMQLLGS